MGEKFGVHYSSLFQHKKKHISDEYKASVRLGPMADIAALKVIAAKTEESVLDQIESDERGGRWEMARGAGVWR
jgi:hypothetical protein